MQITRKTLWNHSKCFRLDCKHLSCVIDAVSLCTNFIFIMSEYYLETWDFYRQKCMSITYFNHIIFQKLLKRSVSIFGSYLMMIPHRVHSNCSLHSIGIEPSTKMVYIFAFFIQQVWSRHLSHFISPWNVLFFDMHMRTVYAARCTSSSDGFCLQLVDSSVHAIRSAHLKSL